MDSTSVQKEKRQGIADRNCLEPLETSNPSRLGGVWTDFSRFGWILRLRLFDVSNWALPALFLQNQT